MPRTSRRLSLLAAAAAVLLSVAGPGTAAAAGGTTPAGAAGERVKAIVTFEQRPGRAAEQAVEALGGRVRQALGLVQGLAIEIPAGRLRALERTSGVRSVELDHPLTAFDHAADTGDLEYENAWGVEHIGTPEAHAAGLTGAGIKLAIIDTGIDYVHDDPDDTPYVVDPEFLSNYAGGYDFYNDDADPFDDNGHGTHVAGIAAAERNGYLVAGVAPEVELYALKILGPTGEGEYSGLIAALGWAVANDIDVVNMSLGAHEVSAALELAVQEAAAAGVVMVAASGNINPLSWEELFYGCPVAYPAAYPEVIAVSFTGQDDRLTGWSCTGPQVDLAAPGDGIFSPVPTGTCMFCSPLGYSAQSGTSMASPHVAGVAALVLQAGIANGGDLNTLGDDIRAHLCAQTAPAAGMATTDPRYPNWYGCGIVDADKALVDNPPDDGGPNEPPIATDDAATVAEDGTVDVAVLANDTDGDGDALTVSAVGAPSHGSATAQPNGTIRYVPAADYHGPDTFGYSVSDGHGGTDDGAVTITVTAANDPPTAADDVATTAYQTAVSVPVLANDSDPDGDPLSVVSVGAAGHGVVSIGPGGGVTYTPATGYSGPDSFAYTAGDGHGGTDTATVAVTVGAAPPPNPIHVGDLDRTTTSSGKTWGARVTIRIDSAAHAGVAGAVVTGTWSGGASAVGGCTTNSTGSCTVQLTKLSKSTVASVSFTVGSAAKAGSTYDPPANHDPDGDSSGTSILVNRPT